MMRRLKLLMPVCILICSAVTSVGAMTSPQKAMLRSFNEAISKKKQAKHIDAILKDYPRMSKDDKLEVIEAALKKGSGAAYDRLEEIKVSLEGKKAPPLSAEAQKAVTDKQAAFQKTIDDVIKDFMPPAKAKRKKYLDAVEKDKRINKALNDVEISGFKLFDKNGKPEVVPSKLPAGVEDDTFIAGIKALDTDGVRFVAEEVVKDAREAKAEAKKERKTAEQKKAEALNEQLVKFRADAEEIAGVDGDGGDVVAHAANYADAEQGKKNAFDAAKDAYKKAISGFNIPDVPADATKKVYKKYIEDNNGKIAEGKAIVAAAKKVLAAAKALKKEAAPEPKKPEPAGDTTAILEAIGNLKAASDVAVFKDTLKKELAKDAVCGAIVADPDAFIAALKAIPEAAAKKVQDDDLVDLILDNVKAKIDVAKQDALEEAALKLGVSV